MGIEALAGALDGSESEADLEQTTTEHGLVEKDGVGYEGRLGELDVGVASESRRGSAGEAWKGKTTERTPLVRCTCRKGW